MRMLYGQPGLHHSSMILYHLPASQHPSFRITEFTFSWTWIPQKLSEAYERHKCQGIATVDSIHAVNHFSFQPPAGTGMPMMPQQPVMFAQPMMRPPFGAAAVPGTQVSFLYVHKIMTVIYKYETVMWKTV